MMLVEPDHVLEGKITDDVTVQNKEWLIVLAEDVSRQGQRTSCNTEQTFNNSLSTWLPHADAYTAAHFLLSLQQRIHTVVRQVAAAKTKTVETKGCTDMSKVAVMLLGAARWKRKCCSM